MRLLSRACGVFEHTQPCRQAGSWTLTEVSVCSAGKAKLKQYAVKADVPANKELQKVRVAFSFIYHSMQCFCIASSGCTDSNFTCLPGTHQSERPFHLLEA